MPPGLQATKCLYQIDWKGANSPPIYLLGATATREPYLRDRLLLLNAFFTEPLFKLIER